MSYLSIKIDLPAFVEFHGGRCAEGITLVALFLYVKDARAH
jgi:hypothetical protein